MSIEKHPTHDGWYYVKSYPNGRNGKPHRDLITNGYHNAVKLDNSLKSLKSGNAPKLTHPKLKDTIDDYLLWCKANNAERTVYEKERRFHYYIIPGIGEYRVKDLSQKVYDTYCKDLPLWTWFTDYRFINAYVTWMVKRGYAERMTWMPETPKGKPSIKPVAHPSDMLKAIASIPKEKFRVLFSLMLYTALRWNEARWLKWEDTDLKTWTITVKEIQNAVQDYIIIPEPLRKWFEINAKQSGLIWEGMVKGKPYARLETTLRNAGKAAGIKLTSHSFRHASATYLYEQTHDIYQVQAHLRHSKVTTTQIYARMSISRRNSAVGSVIDYVSNNKY